jgi:glycosyltransferase involved in cell wall biosynthesis
MYNEGSVVALIRNVLDEFMTEVKGETEFILVNDDSTDSTLTQIAAWAYEDPRVKVPRGQMIPSDPLPSLAAVQRTSVLYDCKRN